MRGLQCNSAQVTTARRALKKSVDLLFSRLTAIYKWSSGDTR